MRRVVVIIIALVTGIATWAQCPQVTCPGNITVGNDTFLCGAVINYNVFAQDTCGSGVDTFSFSGQIDTFLVPNGITQVTIEARGAQGADVSLLSRPGGLGAIMIGDFAVTPGQKLKILVGEAAPNALWVGGGGGGSFVVDTANNPLIVAGGGGGAIYQVVPHAGINATVNNTGNAGHNGTPGGTGGNGGSSTRGGGGGGLLTDGAEDSQAPGSRGRSFLNGGAGGVNNGTNTTRGGFGGGGGAIRIANNINNQGAGGGGGYSGGGGAGANNQSHGGGGGSCNVGTNQSNTGGANSGNGLVIISYFTPSTLTQTQGLASGSTFPIGTTTNEFVASGSGPNDTCSFTVTVIDSGQATVLGALSQDTICTSAGTLTLPAGTPAGGNYSGTGVTGNSFDPAVAQLGNHWIYYTDTVGCQHTDSAMITVVWCTGIEEGVLSEIVKISPNPSNGLFQLSIPQGEHFEKLELFDASGRKIWKANEPENTTQIDLRNNANGLYMLHVGMKGQQQVFRLLKN